MLPLFGFALDLNPTNHIQRIECSVLINPLSLKLQHQIVVATKNQGAFSVLRDAFGPNLFNMGGYSDPASQTININNADERYIPLFLQTLLENDSNFTPEHALIICNTLLIQPSRENQLAVVPTERAIVPTVKMTNTTKLDLFLKWVDFLVKAHKPNEARFLMDYDGCLGSSPLLTNHYQRNRIRNDREGNIRFINQFPK